MKDWHDHQQGKINSLKRDLSKQEAIVSDLLRLSEKYADENATLKKEKELKKAQSNNYLLHFVFAVCFILAAYNAYDMSMQIQKLKSENQMLLQKQPVGERRQA